MSALTVEVVPSEDPTWDQRLEPVAHDVYHRAGYHRFTTQVEGAPTFLIDVRDRASDRGFVWPYVLRSVSDIPGLSGSEGRDVGSVYGYPGPLAWGCRPGDEFIAAAGEAVVSVWREQGAITAFTRFNPILDNVKWGAGLPLKGPDGNNPLLVLGETVGIDLRLDDVAAISGYRKTLRYEIGRARRLGMVTRHDDDWSGLDSFAALYEESMDRNGADPSYLYSADEFRRLRAELIPILHLFVSELEGRIVAAGLFTECRGILQAHLIGTKYLKWSPLQLLFDDVRRWARLHGDYVMHIGGGRGGLEDQLFAFKARFSRLRYPFSVGRWLLDRSAYATLCAAARQGGAGEPRSSPADDLFFPAYRAFSRSEL